VPDLTELVNYLSAEQDLLKRLAAKALLSGVRAVKPNAKNLASAKSRPRKPTQSD